MLYRNADRAVLAGGLLLTGEYAYGLFKRRYVAALFLPVS